MEKISTISMPPTVYRDTHCTEYGSINFENTISFAISYLR